MTHAPDRSGNCGSRGWLARPAQCSTGCWLGWAVTRESDGSWEPRHFALGKGQFCRESNFLVRQFLHLRLHQLHERKKRKYFMVGIPRRLAGTSKRNATGDSGKRKQDSDFLLQCKVSQWRKNCKLLLRLWAKPLLLCDARGTGLFDSKCNCFFPRSTRTF